MAKLKEILFSLHIEQFTGRVTLKKDQVTKSLFFRKGTPVYVESSLRSETLGQMLLEHGKLTSEQYQAVMEKMEQTGKRQGEVIVELGYLSAFELFEALKLQSGQKLQNCFLLDDADLTSDEGEKFIQGIPEIPVEFFRIFLESVYATYSAGEQAPVPEQKAPKLTTPGREYLAKQSLSQTEAKITRLLDGRKSVAAIFEAVVVDPDEGHAFLGALQTLKLIEFDTPAPQRFTKLASEVTQPGVKKPEEERRVIEVKSEPAPPEKSSPIYAWALKIGRPYHEIFKLDTKANRFQVRKRFEDIVRELHLDAIDDHYEAKDHAIAESVLDHLTLAATILSDDKRKHDYYQALAKKATAEIPPTVLAEVCIQKAKLLMARKKFDKAQEQVQKAIELAPKESGYHVELADILMYKALAEKKPVPEIVERTLKMALSLNHSDARAFFQLGVLAKLAEDLDKAHLYFQKVLEVAPKHQQAGSELRLLEKRLGERKKGSSLMNLFKKKE